MRTQLTFGLWDHAAHGPLVAAAAPMLLASAASAAVSTVLGKALAPKAPKAPTAQSAPQPPRPPQPFSQGGGLFGSTAGSMGGTFLTGRASSAPVLSGSSGKKTLLGA